MVSYLTALGSRDLVLAAHQEVTRAWWATRDAFEIYILQFVLDEASAGHPEASARRLVAVREAPLLEVTDEVVTLGERLVRDGGLPSRARVDALHVAVATVHGMDYLLSWNCTSRMRRWSRSRCHAQG